MAIVVTKVEQDRVAAPTLVYGDIVTRSGISIDRSHAGVRIFLPPVYTLRGLRKGYWIGSASLVAFGLLEVLQSYAATGGFKDAIIPLAQVSVALLIIGGFAWRRL